MNALEANHKMIVLHTLCHTYIYIYIYIYIYKGISIIIFNVIYVQYKWI